MVRKILPGRVVVTAMVLSITLSHGRVNRSVQFIEIECKLSCPSASRASMPAAWAGVALKVVVVVVHCSLVVVKKICC